MIPVEANEFAFEFDPAAITDGNIVLTTENTGAQVHELVLAKIPADADLMELIQSEEPPEGVEDVGGLYPIPAGATVDMAFTEPLESGRYAMLCFLPNTDEALGEVGTPHAFLGMVNEFTIGSP
jgi:hypothetical protein